MSYQALASDLPFYDIVVPQKVPLSKTSDDVFACNLWFGSPLIKNPGYAFVHDAIIAFTFHAPSCLDQETAKELFDLRVKLPYAHLFANHAVYRYYSNDVV